MNYLANLIMCGMVFGHGVIKLMVTMTVNLAWLRGVGVGGESDVGAV
jgi:hypothetical protein